MVRGPGVSAERVVNEPVSTAATFGDHVDIAPPEDIQGRSLRPLWEGQRWTRDLAYSKWHGHLSRCGVGLKLRTVRTKRHKGTFELDSGAGEFTTWSTMRRKWRTVSMTLAMRASGGSCEDMMHVRRGRLLEHLPEPVGMG